MIGIVESGLMEASLDVDPAVATGPGLKFDGSSWHSWEQSNHAFTPVSVTVNNVLLQAAPTANRRQYCRTKTDVMALLDDVYGIRPTVILPEGLVSVDWDMGDDFLCVLSGNRQSSFYMFHSKPGMEIDMLVSQQRHQPISSAHGTRSFIGLPVPRRLYQRHNAGTSAMLR